MQFNSDASFLKMMTLVPFNYAIVRGINFPAV